MVSSQSRMPNFLVLYSGVLDIERRERKDDGVVALSALFFKQQIVLTFPGILKRSLRLLEWHLFCLPYPNVCLSELMLSRFLFLLLGHHLPLPPQQYQNTKKLQLDLREWLMKGNKLRRAMAVLQGTQVTVSASEGDLAPAFHDIQQHRTKSMPQFKVVNIQLGNSIQSTHKLLSA